MSDLFTPPTVVQLKVTAAMVRAHLATVFSEAQGYACLFEVASGTGSHARTFADAVVMNLWPSRGMELVGYEVKVARSDWQLELKKPDKAWPVMQYCDRWILLAAPGVAKAEEIPVPWGWHEFDGDKIRVRKAAPQLAAKQLDRTFLGAMLRKPIREVEATVRREVDARRKVLDDEFEQRVQARASIRMKEAAEAMAKVREIKDATGIDLLAWQPGTPEVIAALKFALSAAPFARWGGLHHAIREQRGALTVLESLQATLQEFAPEVKA